MNILGRRSDLLFSRKSERKKEKSTVSLRISKILFVGSYLQVTWWALGQRDAGTRLATALRRRPFPRAAKEMRDACTQAMESKACCVLKSVVCDQAN